MPKAPPEIRRILAAPKFSGTAPDLTRHFKLPHGRYNLYPIQSQALYEAKKARGMLGMIGVGHGKTLISLLLPIALNAKRPLLLVPAPMLEQFETMRAEFSKHFRMPDRLEVMPYSKLSNPKSSHYIESLRPDLIIADEAHKLKNRESARTSRLARHFRDHPDTMFCPMSGTFTQRSIKDFAHLSHWALGNNSPLPIPNADNHVLLENWAKVVDSDGIPTGYAWASIQPFFVAMTKGKVPLNQQNVRKAFRYRLTSTPGVVATKSGSVGASLIIYANKGFQDAKIKRTLDYLEKNWRTPSGEEIADPMVYARVASQLSQGFFYEWEWPGGVPDEEWLTARSRWFRTVRRIIQRNVPGLDSMALVRDAVAGGKINTPQVKAHFEHWFRIKDRVEPVTKTRWVSRDYVKAMVDLAHAQPSPTVLWYKDKAVERLLQAQGIPTFGQGSELPSSTGTIACSIRVHGTGKNMQAWNRHLVIAPPSNGEAWEQLLGRSHRAGQKSDEVHFMVMQHTKAFARAFRNAKRDAAYIQSVTGSPQKLVYANIKTLAHNDSKRMI